MAASEVEEVLDAHGGVAGELLQPELERTITGAASVPLSMPPMDGDHTEAAHTDHAHSSDDAPNEEVGLEDLEDLGTWVPVERTASLLANGRSPWPGCGLVALQSPWFSLASGGQGSSSQGVR